MAITELANLADSFFVRGTVHRALFGAAPAIQFNQQQNTSVKFPDWLDKDVQLFQRILGVGFFHYGPRLWMIGETEPLIALQDTENRARIIDEIVTKYYEVNIGSNVVLYRIRKSPSSAHDALEYDSPPDILLGRGRLDSVDLPIFYCSPDLELCIHECRVSAEDDLFVASVSPTTQLRLLDLSRILIEKDVTEFESLDLAVHMLFLAGAHSYPISREIAIRASKMGYDGLIYPSYFSLIRSGSVPFSSFYGISQRRFPEMQEHEDRTTSRNIAIFGRPIKQNKITVRCMNKLILRKVEYDFQFGPVDFR